MNDMKLIKAALSCRFKTHRPVVLSHTITKRCNARCLICDYWTTPRRNELTTYEIFNILSDARKIGIVQYTVWGGEPLLREDIPDVLTHAKECGMHTTLITNGFLLDKYADKLINLDALIVSIDYPNEKHDDQRNLSGTFSNAMSGIDKMKKICNNIALNCVISKFNIGMEEEIIKFAHEKKLKIAFEPMQIIDGFNEHMALTNEEKSRSFEKIHRLKRKYRIINSYDYICYMFKFKNFTCHAPKMFVTINEVGELVSCSMQNTSIIADLRNKRLSEILISDTYNQYINNAESCTNKCNYSEAGEMSALYSLEPRAWYNLMKDIVR